ncbi:MAG: xylulokinase [Burkholderiales bacterium RIFOXYC12_FULL_65_23]|uniref:xylulokinase n=1 Tax=Malikia spinosa TaxID=86180 RepID=UPI0008BF59D9|nr:MAG: xylulokinase [Burkholderiales bacterium RIFOXYC12_FULL_65_23]
MFLGLDLGTSELKALLLDRQHRVLATARAPLTVQRPQPLWSEQSPAAWWQALETVMDQLQREQPAALARLEGVGLSGQMHGAVLLDAEQAVLRPAILWNDGRSAAQCEALSQAVPELAVISGNLAMPGFTAPKLLWVREHEPALFERVALVLLPKDWLRLQLTGEAVSEMSDAAGTLWLDTAKRDWSDRLLQATGLSRAQMPRLVEGSARSGVIQPELCRRWGLPEGLPVAGGAGDNAASAIGMGLVEPGQGFVSLGTSGVVFVSGDHFEPNPAQAVHAFCHALPGRWHQMSVMLSAASALSWATRLLGYADEAALIADAATLDPARQQCAPLFLPYLGGERSPHNNPQAQASWTGLSHEHQRADLAYAVAEGVGFGLRDGLLTLGQGSAPPQALSLVGGGARSAWWAQLLAHILGLRLNVHAGGELGGALGAARLGWLCAGGRLDEVCRQPPIEHSYEPDPAIQQRLLLRHQRFQALYRALHPALHPAAGSHDAPPSQPD